MQSLFAPVGRRKRPDRHFTGRGAVDGVPGRSIERTTISRELQRTHFLGRIFAA
jgi:hypothetical protein